MDSSFSKFFWHLLCFAVEKAILVSVMWYLIVVCFAFHIFSVCHHSSSLWSTRQCVLQLISSHTSELLCRDFSL
jgi:hypothetical protein